jgi:hypothetical protein
MKTQNSVSVGKLSENEFNQFILSFNACHKANDKKQALLVWLKKYNVNNFGTPISMCGMITRLENPEVTFENGETVSFYSL